jgi:hypothetical protein
VTIETFVDPTTRVSGQSVRHSRWGAPVTAVLLGVAILAGCSSDPDQDPHRACGIVDAGLVKEATGQAKFSNAWSADDSDSYDGHGLLAIGQDDDGSPRKKFECTVTDSTNHAFLQVSGRSTVSPEDRSEMLATFKQSASGAGCEERQASPLGFVCTEGARTTTGLMFTDRWVRVTAEAKRVSERDADATISPELVLKIAENINTNLG